MLHHCHVSHSFLLNAWFSPICDVWTKCHFYLITRIERILTDRLGVAPRFVNSFLQSVSKTVRQDWWFFVSLLSHFLFSMLFETTFVSCNDAENHFRVEILSSTQTILWRVTRWTWSSHINRILRSVRRFCSSVSCAVIPTRDFGFTRCWWILKTNWLRIVEDVRIWGSSTLLQRIPMQTNGNHCLCPDSINLHLTLHGALLTMVPREREFGVSLSPATKGSRQVCNNFRSGALPSLTLLYIRTRPQVVRRNKLDSLQSTKFVL